MCHHHPSRRAMLGMLATAPLLSACKPAQAGPEDIRWGREVCEICGMIISDARFGTEIRGGADKRLYKFDDIGDAVHWLEVQDWKDAPEIEFWVRDMMTGTQWLDARKAFYEPGVMSPMDYGFGALTEQPPGAVTFIEMKREVLAKGLSSRCLPFEG